ncbi:hypothetical protein G5S34_17530 [Herbaspirillum frisingense]|uniref:hypothetical protein n=1 Tax=Herbaspirillum frisingense TaxID=92645 RepID=UPI0016018F84|nr:hypothetical protein [Herbaspirillum frisingense]QNB08375.1 hypothetical protein G5S34_17530 [Herbaspirillum frisingense]
MIAPITMYPRVLSERERFLVEAAAFCFHPRDERAVKRLIEAARSDGRQQLGELRTATVTQCNGKHTAPPYFLSTEYPSAYVRDLMTEGGRWTELNAKDHGGFAFIVTGMTQEHSRNAICKATAEFVVSACNSRDDLVQALKDCLELMRHDGYSAGTSATMADAEAALAKAGVQ